MTGRVNQPDVIRAWNSYNFHYGINRKFFQYAPLQHRFVTDKTVTYYENKIVTGLENTMWWVQPMFGLIVGLLLLAGYLGVR
jgi:hypothetical protein